MSPPRIIPTTRSISPDIDRSAVRRGIDFRISRWANRGPSPAFKGLRNSRPWAPHRYSIATTRRAFSRMWRAFKAAPCPIELWSSWFAGAGVESAEAGGGDTLFSGAGAAAGCWGGTVPRWSAPGPLGDGRGLGVRAGGGSLVAFHDLAVVEELHLVPRHELLPHLLLQAGEPCVEGRGAPAKGLEAHGRRDLRVLEELERVRDEEAPEPRHHGGAVQDREPFLRLQAEGPEAPRP